MCFLFQAEDGIRDLVRSRGLGDVYKRQQQQRVRATDAATRAAYGRRPALQQYHPPVTSVAPVSYTHLTLPTSDLV